MGTILADLMPFMADCVLFLHVIFIVFMILGAICIVAGAFLEIGWTKNRPFRVFHLLSMVFVVASAWGGWTCPLTTLENILLPQGGRYEIPFVRYWLIGLIYYDAEPWVFITAYTLFAVLIAVGWLINPPRSRSPKIGGGARGDNIK
jgi:hypothetical protein